MLNIPDSMLLNMGQGYMAGSFKDWVWVYSHVDFLRLFNTDTGSLETFSLV